MQERRFDKIVHWTHNTQNMKSMKTKAKAKKHNGKFGRDKFPPKEVTPINPDLSQLRKPIDTSVSTLYRASKVLENGSDEVRSILAYECDLVYECRICRSLFRSLVNFISHKRIYCKEKFDVTFFRNSPNDHDAILVSKPIIPKPEKIHQEVHGNDRILRSQVPKEEEKKDLTSVVSMLQKKQSESLCANVEQPYFENVQSNSPAIYQTVESIISTQSYSDLMKTQVKEQKDMISKQTAVLGPDGQVLQSNQECNGNNRNNGEGDYTSETEVVCSTCGARFSTKKTLAVHTRRMHTSHKLCYLCPCCSNTFANTWSVYRHLFKVHRKSNKQVRKLRSQIQEKAFIKDTVQEDLQAQQNAEKSLTSEALRVNETQEWMDQLESDAALQRCGGCGKRFDRKAALSAHSQYCHKRVAAYESTTKMKKINKISPDRIISETIITSESSNNSNNDEMSIRVEAVGSLSKADWDLLGNDESVAQSETSENVTVVTNEKEEKTIKYNPFPASDGSDPLEIVYTNINKHKTNVGSRKRKNKDSARKLITNIVNDATYIPVEVDVEKETRTEKVDHVLVMETKVASIVNLQKLQCLLCKQKFTSVTNLKRHAAIHIGWNRYQCKLCDFKCFVKCDCVAHCNKVHNAQNNRITIEEMITQIPDNQYIREQDITLDVNNIENEFHTSKAVEISISPRYVEPEVQLQEKAVNEIEAEVEDETKVKGKSEVEGETKVEGEVEAEEAKVEDKVDAEEEEKVEGEIEAEEEAKVESEVVDKNLVTFQEIVDLHVEDENIFNNGTQGQNTLGLDPELRKMVMEVIFGSSETNSTKEEVKETPEKSNLKLQNTEEIETQSKSSDSRESSDVTCSQDNSKPQRPIRNKIKPMNKDFIYDLNGVVFRKDGLIMRPLNKPLMKKPLLQEEDNLEDTEQTSKRFKNDEMPILCENSVTDKCDIKFTRERLKSNVTFSQCHR
ncbi:LOW QUALITY PROTEIN: zinc finger protein 800 [Hylaeus volcanicus]|uniref:LOW QUALITY PROTEIN: zinc finger protein 800 n=1 Tax=Hylaeus volcanicus TaxID=313075 RepID=UPI0023B77477|nr:LOW QUALITY PROTEIN: zinc finger protein 800 [Hylaeus volcanicus]